MPINQKSRGLLEKFHLHRQNQRAYWNSADLSSEEDPKNSQVIKRIDELFQRIYVINLTHRTDRWEGVLREFSKYGIKNFIRFPAIAHDIGYVGCRESHLAVLRSARNEGVENFIVFEDDFIFLRDPASVIHKALGKLPEDWDMLYLGGIPLGPLKRYSQNLFHLHLGITSHAIAYNNRKSGIVDYIINQVNSKYAIDQFFYRDVQKNRKCFIVFPILSIQKPGFSDVEKRNRDCVRMNLKFFERVWDELTSLEKCFYLGQIFNKSTLRKKAEKFHKKLSGYVRFSRAKNRVLPNFLLLGSPQSYAILLYRHLVCHPQVISLFNKKEEINYFNKNIKKGALWYKRNFPLKSEVEKLRLSLGDPILVGEATSAYFYHPQGAKFARELIPNVKIIVLLRNPTEGAFLQYHYEISSNLEPQGFDEAMENEPVQTPESGASENGDAREFGSKWNDRSYLSRGKYFNPLDRWMQCFPREQFLILKSEDLFLDPETTGRRVLKFLGLPSDDGIDFSKITIENNCGIPLRLRQKLNAYFEQENQKLYQLINEDFGW